MGDRAQRKRHLVDWEEDAGQKQRWREHQSEKVGEEIVTGRHRRHHQPEGAESQPDNET